MLGHIYATKQFRQYLLGRPFKLFTDHAPLQWLSAQKAEGMLARWALALQEFDFSISYKPGVQNANADALSRISSCSAVMITTKDYQVKLQEEQKSDPFLSIVYHGVQKKKRPTTSHPVIRCYLQLWSQLILCNGILCRQYFPDNSLSSVTVPVLAQTLQSGFLKEVHVTPSAEHLGFSRTLSRAQNEVYWVNMANDICMYCSRGIKCQQSKLPKPSRAQLQNTPIGHPWQMVAVDILEVPLSAANNRYLLVI